MKSKSKVLVVFAHPEPKSFCAAMKDTVVDTLINEGHEVKVSDLYRMKFVLPLDKTDFTTLTNPGYFKPQTEQVACNSKGFEGFSPEVKEEHEKVKWADTLIFVYPLYWWSVPGIMKNWIDRILSMGFAYGMKGQASLKPRKGMIMYTTGGPKAFHTSIGMEEVAWKLMNNGVFKFCGMTALQPHVVYQPAWVDDTQRKKFLEEVAELMKNIDTREECKL